MIAWLDTWWPTLLLVGLVVAVCVWQLVERYRFQQLLDRMAAEIRSRRR